MPFDCAPHFALNGMALRGKQDRPFDNGDFVVRQTLNAFGQPAWAAIVSSVI
jgi:hypothetical protein